MTSSDTSSEHRKSPAKPTSSRRDRAHRSACPASAFRPARTSAVVAGSSDPVPSRACGGCPGRPGVPVDRASATADGWPPGAPARCRSGIGIGWRLCAFWTGRSGNAIVRGEAGQRLQPMQPAAVERVVPVVTVGLERVGCLGVIENAAAIDGSVDLRVADVCGTARKGPEPSSARWSSQPSLRARSPDRKCLSATADLRYASLIVSQTWPFAPGLRRQ